MYLFFLQVNKCIVNTSSSNNMMIVYVTQEFAFGSIFSVDVPLHYLWKWFEVICLVLHWNWPSTFIQAVITFPTKVTVAVSSMIGFSSFVLITSGISMPVVFGSMIIHYFLCRTVQSTVWNGKWFWNYKMSLCIEHHTLWRMGCVHMNEKRERENRAGSCTAKLKNLLEYWFLVSCITFHTWFFFLFQVFDLWSKYIHSYIQCVLYICT